MKKRIFALCCALTLLFGATAFPAQALAGEGERAAETLEALNVVRGSHNVDDIATRNQAVVLLLRLVSAEPAVKASAARTSFTDLAAWAAPSVRFASAKGWISGVSATKFDGDAAISANDSCLLLMQALGYTAGVDFRADAAVTFARHMAVATRNYEGEMTRGDLFELAAGALNASFKGSDETVAERLVATGVTTAAALDAQGLTAKELTTRQIADRYTAAVFQLSCYDSKAAVEEKWVSATGSGFFISEDGLAVTNYHTIDGMIRCTAKLSSGEEYLATRVVYYDADIDIAVLRFSTTSTDGVGCPGFVHLDPVSRDTLRVGDVAYTISNPLGVGLAVSSGVISSTHQNVNRYKLPVVMSTADISQGSSGGALLNIYGQVSAITSGAYTGGNGTFLAVPIDPIFTADLSAEGQTLAEVVQRQASTQIARVG